MPVAAYTLPHPATAPIDDHYQPPLLDPRDGEVSFSQGFSQGHLTPNNAMAAQAPPALGHPPVHALWPQLCEALSSSLSAATVHTWLIPLQAVDIQYTAPCTLTLGTDSAFKRDWVSKHYATAIGNALTDATGMPNWQLAITVQAPNAAQTQLLAAEDDTPAHTAAPPQLNASERHYLHAPESHQTLHPSLRQLAYNSRSLNPKYTFDTLVTGQHNEFAVAAAQLLAQQPGQRYNPLMIYGGTGLGKTHLLHAIGHHIQRHRDDASVCVVTAEQFTNELINAVNKKQWQPFRNRYRQADVLLIDDVQFLGGKERTQQEFFHTLNTLTETGKQVVLTSDRCPAELQGLDERLRSRFDMGLLVKVTSPDDDTRRAILTKKAEDAQLFLTPELADYLVDAFYDNVRQLEGGLNTVAAYTELQHKLPSLAVMESLTGHVAKKHANVPTPNQVLGAVSAHCNISIEAITGPQRSKPIAHARQLAMHCMRQLTPASLTDIGHHIGGRQHSTVLHACQKVHALAQQDTDIRHDIKAIEHLLS